MREILEEIIVDGFNRPLPVPTPRDVVLPGIVGKADAIVGMRRSGKTWYMFQQMRRLIAEGVAREDLLYLNFEDDRLATMQAFDLHLIPDITYAQDPGRLQRRCWFFLDEIHNIPGWERFVRRMIDENVAVVLSGSSAKMLSREVATSLRGRGLETEILPFSPRELARHHGVTLPTTWPPPRRQRAELRKTCADYLAVGGFPEVQKLTVEFRERIHRSYVDVVLLRDVIERHRVRNAEVLRYLVRRLLRSPSCEFTVTKLYREIKSQGLAVSRESLYELIGYLEDAYLFFTTELFSESVRQRRSNPRKVYVVDHALAVSAVQRRTADKGALFENMVYLELRRRGYELAYGRSKAGFGVDFIAVKGGEVVPVQVSLTIDDPTTRQREIRGLLALMDEYSCQQGWLITWNDAPPLDIDAAISVKPAWRWFFEGAHP
jgi:predicted AAA+ superfamily ATPase